MTGSEQLGEHQGLPLLRFADADSWQAWLGANHTTSAGVWLAIARAGAGTPSVTYEQALDLALCHGWIDGRKQGGRNSPRAGRAVPGRSATAKRPRR